MEIPPFTPEEEERNRKIGERIITDPNSVTWIKPEPGPWTGKIITEDKGSVAVVEGDGFPKHLKE